MTSYTFKQTALCCVEGQRLYEAWAEFYGYEADWTSISKRRKDEWVETAKNAIEDVGPSRARVIATISPTEPWGREAV